MNESTSASWLNFLRKKTVWVTFGLLLALLILNPFTCIDSGSKGLRFTNGALDDAELDEGLNVAWPVVQKIRQVTIRPIEHTFKIEVGADGAITKDNQSIGVTISVYFSYLPGQLVSMWRTIGEDKMLSIISATALENYKKVVGQYTIFDVASNQEKIRSQVAEMTKANLAGYPVKVNEFKVTNYDWSESFERQIEQTMTLAQQVKQKQEELNKEALEAQKKVKIAEATKTATILEAEGRREAARLDAEGKTLEGEGIRKYNASVAQNQEFELKKLQLAIEMKKAEKWNGQYVPQNHYGPIPVSTAGLQPEK